MNESFEIVKVQVNGPLPKRGRSKPKYLEKNPNNQSDNLYHIIEVKIYRPNWDSNSRPLTLVIS